MTTKAQRAHVHLLEGALHDCVRTVEKREWTERNGGGNPGPADTRRYHRRIMFLHSNGRTRQEIRDDTGLSLTTIGRHITGRIKG